MSSPADKFLSAELPERRNPARDSIPTQPAALRQWVESLPMANPGVAARMLFNAVRELNGYLVDPATRVRLLDLLRAPIQQMAQSLDRQILNQPFPLPAQKRQFGDASRDFQLQLATGYRLAAYDLCRGRTSVPFLKGGLVLSAVARAMAHLRDGLLKCYLGYAAVPAGLWSQMHGLVRFAHAMGLLQKAHQDELSLARPKCSPAEIYLQAALLSLANPYRLSQSELVEVSCALEQWSRFGSIGPGADVSGAGQFLVDVGSDLEPGRVPRGEGQVPVETWVLSSAGVAKFLQTELSAAQASGGAVEIAARGMKNLKLDLELVDGLMASWGATAERGFQRLPARHQLSTVLGLDAVHYMLAGRLDFLSFVNEVESSGRELNGHVVGSNWTGLGTDQFRPAVLHARVLDQSLGGYRVVWENMDSVRAKVGELIGLSTGGDEADEVWMVGVLRWLRVQSHDEVEAGIELVSRRARAVAVRAPEGRLTSFQRGMVLGPLKAGQGPRTLVLPGFVAHTAQEIELRAPEQLDFDPEPLPKSCFLGDPLEATDHFSQFTLAETAAAIEVAKAADEPAWGLL